MHQPEDPRKTHRGPSRLLQILISKSAHLAWVLRCERVIQEKNYSENEIRGWWHQVINRRLTDDKITATKIKRDNGFTRLVVDTWSKHWVKKEDSHQTGLAFVRF
jgi:hypothetical protein